MGFGPQETESLVEPVGALSFDIAPHAQIADALRPQLFDRLLDEALADTPATPVGIHRQAGNFTPVPFGQAAGDKRLQASDNRTLRQRCHQYIDCGIRRRSFDAVSDFIRRAFISQLPQESGDAGGYCFEHNILMAAVLTQLGFSVRQLAARVRLGSDQVRARTHMLLMVDLDGQPLLADVGFGAQGFQKPLPFVPGKIFRRFRWQYRIVPEDEAWVLQSQADDRWIDLYAFTLEPQYWIDYKVANHYVSTHPDSQFASDLIVQRPTPETRFSLHNFDLHIDRGTSVATRRLRNQAERLEILADIFDLHFPPETAFGA